MLLLSVADSVAVESADGRHEVATLNARVPFPALAVEELAVGLAATVLHGQAITHALIPARMRTHSLCDVEGDTILDGLLSAALHVTLRDCSICFSASVTRKFSAIFIDCPTLASNSMQARETARDRRCFIGGIMFGGTSTGKSQR